MAFDTCWWREMWLAWRHGATLVPRRTSCAPARTSASEWSTRPTTTVSTVPTLASLARRGPGPRAAAHLRGKGVPWSSRSA
ncbi:hypothetical protein QJS66_01845 [Kocuria rhizophila]|nr:hypothetical protein QJS66_01845 [Kocuria rhizophila]